MTVAELEMELESSSEHAPGEPTVVLAEDDAELRAVVTRRWRSPRTCSRMSS
jgi:hypothetical protein